MDSAKINTDQPVGRSAKGVDRTAAAESECRRSSLAQRNVTFLGLGNLAEICSGSQNSVFLGPWGELSDWILGRDRSCCQAAAVAATVVSLGFILDKRFG